MTLDMYDKLIHIAGYFRIGMPLYTATVNGKVLSYTLNKITIEVLTNEIVNIVFECESDYMHLDEYFKYEDIEKKILFTDKDRAQEQANKNYIEFFGHEKKEGN